MTHTYEVKLLPPARLAIETQLPEKIAAAVLEFIYGPLALNPRRVGKPLRGPLAGRMAARRGDYRVVYEIFEHEILIEIVLIDHRRNVYRPR